MSDPARRTALKLIAGGLSALVIPPLHAESSATAMIKREIPRSHEMLPVIGLGTYIAFDVAPQTERGAQLKKVVADFVAAGGSVIDTSPMYGHAEDTVGTIAAELKVRPELFVATKVWTRGQQAGIAQMRASMRLLKAERIDLMQVHNLLDVAVHMKTLHAWKQSGTIRYLGITHYHSGAYRELEALIRTRDYDFVQFNYSLGEREAEQRLLPAALDTGTAVIINRPFAQGDLFGRVQGLPVPYWAQDFGAETWAQFFLKYIIAQTAVTCVIPATGNPRHLEDNMKAGSGPLPDAKTRQRMTELVRNL
jgi:diketogulonate reductase-like aldo/keto reductase